MSDYIIETIWYEYVMLKETTYVIWQPPFLIYVNDFD